MKETAPARRAVVAPPGPELRALSISPKTADVHIQHIYAKAGVSTRAAATLFALQNDLLDPGPPEA